MIKLFCNFISVKIFILLPFFISSLCQGDEVQIPGWLEGVFKAGPRGAATYTVPIASPPGINGQEPNLELIYHDSNILGPFGVGTLLSSQGSISRCQPTPVFLARSQDSDLKGTKTLCLDGAQLLEKTDVNGIYYVTSTDPHQRIRIYETDTNGKISSLIRYASSGNTFIYGLNENSRVYHGGKVFSWKISRIQDSFGNYQEFYYDKPHGAEVSYLSKIIYTGNDRAQIEPRNEIRFNYQTLGYPLTKYANGHKVLDKSKTRLVQNISIYNRNELVYRYSFEYLKSHDNEILLPARLKKITQCHSDETCIKPIKMSWRDEGVVQNSFQDFQELVDIEVTDFEFNRDKSLFAVEDLNRDGYKDIINMSVSKVGVVVAFGSKSGFKDPVMLKWSYDKRNLHAPLDIAGDHIELRDFNNDGYLDVLGVGKQQAYWIPFKGDGFGKINLLGGNIVHDWGADWQRVWVDYNHDGYLDLFSHDNNSFYVAYGDGEALKPRTKIADLFDLGSTSWDFKKYPVYILDLNSDGYLDALSISGSYVFLQYGKFNGMKPSMYVKSNIDIDFMTEELQWQDINGDGLLDAVITSMVSETKDISVSFNMGLDSDLDSDRSSRPVFTDREKWGRPFNSYDGYDFLQRHKYRRLFFDVNNDALIDHVLFGSKGIMARYNQGHRLHPMSKTIGYAFSFGNWDWSKDLVKFNDLNQDGAVDIIGFSSHSGIYVAYGKKLPPKLQSISYGFDNKINFSYKSLTDPSVHTLSAEHPDNTHSLLGSNEVLSSIEVTTGDNSSKTVSYSYEDYLIHSLEKKSLGFKKRIIIDELTGMKTIETYSQDVTLKLQGMLIKKEIFSRLGTLISQATYSYNTVFRNDYEWSVFLEKTKTTRFDDDGEVIVTVTVDNKSRDDYGYVTEAVELTEGSDGLLRRVQTSTTFWHDPKSGVYGKPETLKVMTAVEGRSAIERSTHNFYSSEGQLIKIVTDPGTAFERTVSYKFNSLGLPVSQTTQWPRSGYGLDFNSLVQKTEYDTYGMPIATINALGMKTVMKIDPVFGKPLSSTSVNGQTTFYEYDALGAISKIIHPNGNEEHISSGFCPGNDHCPETARYFVKTKASGAAAEFAYYDRLGRLVRTKDLSLNGRTVLQDTVYNNYGLAYKQSLSYFEGDPVHWRVQSFDDKLRLIQVTHPDGSVDQLSYDGLSKSFRNSLGQTKQTIVNTLSETIAVIDNQGHKLSYRYDSLSRQLATIKPSGQKLEHKYDLLGQEVAVYDNHQGWAHSKYNALGLAYETSYVDGSRVSRQFDALGRQTRVLWTKPGEPDHDARYSYDDTLYGLGMLSQVSLADGSYQKDLRYDTYSRPITKTTKIMGKSFVETTGYDSLGRPETFSYPSGFSLKSLYNDHGYLVAIQDAANQSREFIRYQDDYASGDIAHKIYGNGVKIGIDIDTKTGLPRAIHAKDKSGTSVHHMSFGFDNLGNLESRRDHVMNHLETFLYDDLNRLDHYVRNGKSTTYSYDAKGNITYKSDLGSYYYGETCAGDTKTPGPNAVTSLKGNHKASYCYDSRGQMISGDGREIAYTAFGKPYEIKRRGHHSHFSYGPGGQRFLRQDNKSGQLTHTYYTGGYELVIQGEQKKHRHYIAGQVVHITYEDKQPETHYLHKDHLGSTVAVTDESGLVKERYYYKPFGQRISEDVDGFAYLPTFSASSHRGFTGHEHVDGVGLIHMNGRMYDPKIGRFLSVDPVYSPVDLQGINAYSYVFNNPLSFVDPDGHWGNVFKAAKRAVKKAGGKISSTFKANVRGTQRTLKKVVKGDVKGLVKSVVRTGFTANNKKLTKYHDKAARWAKDNEKVLISTGIMIVGTAILGPGALGLAGLNLGGAALVAGKMALGAAVGYYQSDGDLKATVVSAVTAGVLHGVGEAFQISGSFSDMALGDQVAHIAGKTAAHGMVGGLRSVAMGGSFEDGFKSAALNQAVGFTGVHDALGTGAIGQGVMATVLGGAMSEATGGSFEDGAILAAMQFAFNDMTHTGPQQTEPGIEEGNWSPVGAIVDWVMDQLPDGLSAVGATYQVSKGKMPKLGGKTLKPGPYADSSIPARGPGRDFKAAERNRINEIGRETGCHTCGSRDPGSKSGNFVPDHQPPNALNSSGDPQRLFPHCISCSRKQGGEINSLRWKK